MIENNENNKNDENALNYLKDKEKQGVYETQKETNNETPNSLGKVQIGRDNSNEDTFLASESGYLTVNVDILPSRGMFYPEGTQIAIRAARVEEIRHFSTIDENDLLDADDKLNYIIQKCMKIKMPNKTASYKDLKEEDRFYIIFQIRDVTFKDGENRIMIPYTCKEGHSHQVELKSNLFNYYKIEDKLLNRHTLYSDFFYISHGKIGEIKLHVPSVGVMSYIKKYIKNAYERKIDFDKAFIKILPFLVSDWRLLNDEYVNKLKYEYMSWDSNRFSAIDSLVDMIKFGVKTEILINCETCEEAVPVGITFPGGIKSLFVISDIIGEVL